MLNITLLAPAATTDRSFRGLRIERVLHALCGLFFLAGLIVSHESVAQSEGAREVDVRLVQYKVLSKNGKEEFVEAEKVAPGELTEYRATYTNRSSKPVRNLGATLPIPEGLVYEARSAGSTTRLLSAEFSTKDGKYGQEPLTRSVPGKDGKPVQEVIPYSEYRAVRWTVPELAPGASVQVSARARIESGVTQATPGKAQKVAQKVAPNVAR